MASIVKNYASNRSPISHKYLNHGIYNVPIFNISNPISPLLSEAGRMMVVLTVKAKLRAHSYYDLGAPTPSRSLSRKAYTQGVFFSGWAGSKYGRS